MNDEESQRNEDFRWLHSTSRREQAGRPNSGDQGAGMQNTWFGRDRQSGDESRDGAESQPQPGGSETEATPEQRYAKAIKALNQVITTRNFEALPWVSKVLQATADALHHRDPALPSVRNNQGSAAQLAYLSSGALDDLEDAVTHYRSAASTARDGDSDLVLYLCNLSLALTDLAAKTSDASRAKDAVMNARTAVERAGSGDRRRTTALIRLGNALKLHARLASETSSDDESIDVFREALRGSLGNNAQRASADSSELLLNLGSALLRRYGRGNAQEDLDEGITHLDTGIGMLADSEPRRMGLCQLANALRLRFRQRGDLTDLHTAINELIGVLGVLHAEHPLLGKVLWDLACTTVEHIDTTGEPGQLRHVLRTLAPALRGVAEEDPNRPMALAGFSVLMRRHFLYGADQGALDTAVTTGTQAIEMTSAAPRRCLMLESLATTLIARYEHTSSMADLDHAATLAREATKLSDETSRAHYSAWAQLGIIATHKFRRNSQADELDSAVDLLDHALALMPENAPDRAMVATYLARALQKLHQRTGRRKYYRWARRVLTEASAQVTAPADQRLRAAGMCGRLAAQAQRWAEATESFSTAVELLPLVTRSKRVVASPSVQQRWASITADAAACALENGQPQLAAELVEHGRSALLADFLPASGELGTLHGEDPDLADEAVRVRRLLDKPPEEPVLTGLDIIDDTQRRQELAESWEDLLQEIRAGSGRANHLHLKPFDDVATVSGEGPVVMVNLSRYRSDALILFGGRVLSVALPKAHPSTAAEYATSLLQAVGTDNPSVSRSLDWLWRAVAQPVLDRMGYVTMPGDSQRWPRLWWNVSGSLAFLPLHAATSRSGASALDRVVSSYTPSLGTLLAAKNRGPLADHRFRPLVAAGSMEQAALTGGLPRQNQVLAQSWPRAEVLSEEDTAPQDMLDSLRKHPWTHICEPSVQNPAQPAASLVLARTTADRSLGVVDLGQVPLEVAEFAYLGSCVNTEDPPSSAATPLGASLSFTGYAHVVSTLWGVESDSRDSVHALVMAELADDDSGFAPDRSAIAVHQASRLRRAEAPHDPSSWAAFVHFGP
jgi:hypothetical protein